VISRQDPTQYSSPVPNLRISLALPPVRWYMRSCAMQQAVGSKPLTV
jgi:hypothetical protein